MNGIQMSHLILVMLLLQGHGMELIYHTSHTRPMPMLLLVLVVDGVKLRVMGR